MDGADVISLSDHRRRPAPGTTGPPGISTRPAGPTAHEAPPVDPVLAAIGEQVQALFTSRGRTLTDPATAQAFTITMDGVLNLIDGALAQGLIGPAEHAMLMATFEGMRQAPQGL
ncbi:hypothetical protein HY68_36720 [Streptomyces sp. AcH 505]|nr:hypothetical protein HY68_36720 [Streptomyces sp. AcH 505]